MDGEIYWVKQFYSADRSDSIFQELLTKLAWQEEQIYIFGKWIKVPRLMCWYGDPEAIYTYSNVPHRPSPWIPELLILKEDVSGYCHCCFNSVLANLYRNGRDSMGCHADNERELGINPTIASLSFGDERLFRLYHNKNKQLKLEIPLGHGDLLIMAGALQHHWRHALPKTRQIKRERVNLTFRWVNPVQQV